jgi:phosphoenolpyruvate synthase/pyruvate phosphate dikinase
MKDVHPSCCPSNSLATICCSSSSTSTEWPSPRTLHHRKCGMVAQEDWREPSWPDSPRQRKILGVPAEPSQDPNVVSGTGASPGTVHGRATVVRNLSEASKIQSGDILVCEMTMPAWTPLFSTASAVVSDTGGVLSHCAIVSREYRIPCVVGTVVGTSLLKDGMLLTVDGSRGVVRIDARI